MRAIGGYAVAAVVFNWPLPIRLATHLPGTISGDTGVYVWNLWLFRHEIVVHRNFPMFTHEILSLTSPIDLGLHNYTLFADVLAFPLIPRLGLIATFNLLYLSILVLNGWAMFALARRIVRSDAEAWLAGLLFAFSPFIIARSSAHLSLVAAAPLPLFLLVLIRSRGRWRVRDAFTAGIVMGWASLCDAYYGIFCLLIGACYLSTDFVRAYETDVTPRPSTRRALDALILILTMVVVAVAVTGGTEVATAGTSIRLRSLYTPVLLLTLSVGARVLLTSQLRFAPIAIPRPTATAALVAAAAFACLIPLSPVLYALSYHLRDGGTIHRRIFWRSSPSGMDLLAFFAPNPNHRLFGAPWHWWFASQPGGYEENVAALTITAVAVIAIAVFACRFRPSRIWVAMLAFFGAVSLGPFVHVGTINTYVPTPWTLLRYVPVISDTRTPARYAVVVTMMLSLVFGLALAHLGRVYRERRGAILAMVFLALAFELAPMPRTLYSARIPEIYQVIAADPRDVRVLDLPFGFRDGEWSEGNFTAASQFYQTVHEKPLIGGYLSRLGEPLIERQRRLPLIRQLMRLSEGRAVDPIAPELLARRAARFMQLSHIGYVTMDVRRTPPALRDFAIDAFHLVKVMEGDGRELFVVPLAESEATR